MAERGPPCASCVIMVKDADHPLFRLSLKSVCRAKCLEEILVVTPHPERLSWASSACSKVRLVRDPGWGIGIARNIGVRASRCDIVAFVDPDAVVGTDHFCKILEAFKDPSVGLVDIASTVESTSVKSSLTKVQLLENLVWERGRVAGFEKAGETIYAGGTFMSLRKSVWETVGGFWKYPPYGSDDMDFSYKVYKAGYKCRSIKVKGSFHLPRAALPDLFREQYGWGRGFAFLTMKYAKDKDFWLSLRFNKLIYRVIPSDYWFLVPVLRVIAAPLGGLVNSVKWREPEFLPFWIFRRYSFLLGFLSGLHDYLKLGKRPRKATSLSAKTPHS